MKKRKKQKNLLKNLYSKMSDQRFERKYVFNGIDINKITLAIYRSNFNFFSLFPDRKVNSIYFDDKDLTSISANLDGVTDKEKVRVRWYGNSQIIDNSKLEIKRKSEFLVSKNNYELKLPKKFKFQERKNISYLKDYLNKLKELKKITQKPLYPILSTHYLRSYFLSSNRLIRLTMDKNIEYIHLIDNKDINLKYKTQNIIIELKYKKELDNFVRSKIRNISVRFSKNSKYIHAAQLMKIIQN